MERQTLKHTNGWMDRRPYKYISGDIIATYNYETHICQKLELGTSLDK